MILKETNRQTKKIADDFSFPVSRLVNYTNTAEGPVLPNRVQGGNERVYTVSNLRVARIERVGVNTQFTLTWSAPTEQQIDQLSFYQIYVLDRNLGITQPISTTLARSSPAIVSIEASEGSLFTFLVQTMLKNGQLSDIMSSPSCTALTLDTSDTPYSLTQPATVDTSSPATPYTATVPAHTIGSGQNFQLHACGVYTTIGGANTFDLVFQLYDPIGLSAYISQTIASPVGIVTNAPIILDTWGTFYENGFAGTARFFTTASINGTVTSVFSTSNTTVNTRQDIQFNIGLNWTNFTAGCTATLSLVNLSLL